MSVQDTASGEERHLKYIGRGEVEGLGYVKAVRGKREEIGALEPGKLEEVAIALHKASACWPESRSKVPDQQNIVRFPAIMTVTG